MTQMTRENTYAPRGAALELLRCKADEVVLDGPAGTGKSRAALEKGNMIAQKYPKARLLFARKTRVSMSQTTLVTFEEKVRPACDITNQQRSVRKSYIYPNGSEIVVAGLDNPIAIMSSEYDWIYVPEATELDPNDWELLTSRLRNGVVPYQQLVADLNPGAPTHWLNRRMEAGLAVRLLSRHEDNPRLFDSKGQVTEFGKAYLAKLDKLSGPRYLRLRKGIWAAAEGMVYSHWDPQKHIIDPFKIPEDWVRIRVIDFGFTNAFVCQWWAIDPDGRMYMYREIYKTKTLVEDHAKTIREVEKGEAIEATICDHDAEDRATLERHLGCDTIPAQKDISTGIQELQGRMKDADDGKPRVFFFRDCLVERDPELVDQDTGLSEKPTCTIEEIEGYVWDEKKDKPVKKDDHGVDTARYAAMYAAGYSPVQDVFFGWI